MYATEHFINAAIARKRGSISRESRIIVLYGLIGGLQKLVAIAPTRRIITSYTGVTRRHKFLLLAAAILGWNL
jgi:hypothetical protein